MAGLNIPKREQLENGPKFSDLNKARLKAQDKLSDYAERAAVKGADLAFGEDTGDSFLEDLAYGAVPGGSLYQRAKTGTRPGLLDFADFIPSGGPALKAASLFVPMDLVKSLAKRTGAKGFENKFKRLPKAVQESWISSFGDVHSNKLKEHRDKLGVSDKIDHSLVHAYPKLNTEYLGSASYYFPFENSVQNLGYYQPYISLDVLASGDDLVDALIHEGSHLMDNSMGTAKEVTKMPQDWMYVHPYSGRVSKDWLDKSTTNGYPLRGSKNSMDHQDITGAFSPLEYAYNKKHPSENPDSDPIYWLADDPHGLEFYKNRQEYDWEGNPKPRTIDDDKVAREGFAQFMESIPYTDLGRTPARRKLVELAERDPRRSEDFTVNFDRFEDYLSQPTYKYDDELKQNVVPYLMSYQR
jgi:hypothetical protein